MLDDPKEIERHAVEKLYRTADDPVARQYGTVRFSHKEVVALTARLTVLAGALDRVAPSGGMFGPDECCVWCGMSMTDKDPITCDHDDDCAWVLARQVLGAER